MHMCHESFIYVPRPIIFLVAKNLMKEGGKIGVFLYIYIHGCAKKYVCTADFCDIWRHYKRASLHIYSQEANQGKKEKRQKIHEKIPHHV